MRVTRQEMRCVGPKVVIGTGACSAIVAIEIHGVHDLRSTSLALAQLAWDAGWNIETEQCAFCRPGGKRTERPTR